MMNTLITGGAGFLGSNLTRNLLQEGHKVVAIDDLSTGSQSNIKQFEGNPNYSFIEHDVRNYWQGTHDLIINMACPASPIHYQNDPVKTIETNFLGMANILKLSVETGARVLQASTSEVYGDPIISPQKENYWGNVNPIGIRSCYDEGKRAAETLCFDYQRQFGVDIRVVRIFNTYGPGMSVGDGRVVSNFIVQAIRGEDITVYGDGNQSRSFCYVSDLIDGITKVAFAEKNLGQPINLGNPREFSMIELAQHVIELTNSKSKIKFLELPSDDPKQRCPDISCAINEFSWKPEVDLFDGLKKTIQYFQDLKL
jgi:UDP-glucuronate decarboxylase